MAQALKSAERLSILKLNNCGIGDEGCIALMMGNSAFF